MPKTIFAVIVLFACALPCTGARAQEKNPKVILFHVTSVQRVDDAGGCKAGSCSVVKYRVEGFATAEGEAITTSYVISCDEVVFELPWPHRSNVCARFHAGNAYTAQLMSDRILFPFSGLNKAFETNYNIVSEKEIPAIGDHQGVPGSSEPREATKAPPVREPAKSAEQVASTIPR